MAYTMTHIFIAEKAMDLINFDINYNTYIVGTNAPDAVHAAKEFNVSMKEASHIFDEQLSWGKISSQDDLNRWLDNIKNFYISNQNKYDRDFFLGYVIHLLVDVCSSHDIYMSFYNRYKDDDVLLEKMKHQFKKESYDVNYYLYREYSKTHDLKKILEEGQCYSIENVFDKEVFNNRIEQLFSFEFIERDLSEIHKNEICTLDNTFKLINEATDFIEKVFINEYM